MTTIGVILSVLAAGLAILLARETKLRRALQALCSRLLARISDTQHQRVDSPSSTYHSQRRS